MIGSSVKKIFLSNFISQALSAVVGVAILPFYSKYFNAADYGVFMIFYMAFSWVMIFDLGFTNYLNKEATLYKNGKILQSKFFQVLRTYEVFFLGLILLSILIIVCFRLTNFNQFEFFQSITNDWNWMLLILFAAFLKLFSMLYKASLDGFYLGNIASIASVSFLVLRYVLPFCIVFVYTFSLIDFLLYQVCISVAESSIMLILVRAKGKINIPVTAFSVNWNHVVNKFTLYSSMNTVLYILTTQFDKILLVKVLPLSEYGQYASIIAITNGIFYLSGPFMSTITPRLIGGIAAGKSRLSMKALEGSFDLTSSVIIGSSCLIGINGVLILKVLQPNIISSSAINWIFFLYIVGNGMYSLIGYVNIPQIAFGDVRFNLILSVIIAFLTILCVIYIGPKYGILGLSIFWFIKNFIVTASAFTLVEKFNKVISLTDLSKIFIKKVFINILLATPFLFAIKPGSLLNLYSSLFISVVLFVLLNIVISKRIINISKKYFTIFTTNTLV
jgi:O-antigen/teichoic acid export membrane protein